MNVYDMAIVGADGAGSVVRHLEAAPSHAGEVLQAAFMYVPFLRRCVMSLCLMSIKVDTE